MTFPVVLQEQWKLSREYAKFATPIAYLIDEEGRIAADIALGADAILALGQGEECSSWETSSTNSRRTWPARCRAVKSSVASARTFLGVILAAVGLAADKDKNKPKKDCKEVCNICCDNNFFPPHGREHAKCVQDCRDGVGVCSGFPFNQVCHGLTNRSRRGFEGPVRRDRPFPFWCALPSAGADLGDEVGLPASSFRLPASGFRLPASGFRLPASGFRLPASGFRLSAIS